MQDGGTGALTSASKDITLKGKLNKSVIRDFIEFGCERQLFWNLGEGDPRWMETPRRHTHTGQQVRKPELLLQMGREYEQDVYARLLHSPLRVERSMGAHGRVVHTRLKAEGFARLREELRDSGRSGLVMLEHEWGTPSSLLHWILNSTPEGPIPVAQPSALCRPDVMLMVDQRGRADRALAPGGRLEAVAPEDERFALRLLDVKHTHAEDVGKKQFVELLFYAHSLARYLQEHGLADRLYVSVDGCGIWPVLNLNRTPLRHLDDIQRAIVEMSWDNHAHLFTLALQKIREFYKVTPQPIEDIELLIQPACARCKYIADCKQSLGWRDGLRDLSQIDVRLLPGVSASTAEQLRDRQIDTVAELDARTDELAQEGSIVPSPLYAERELLRLKARALVTGQRTMPDQEQAERRHMSLAVPRYSTAVLAFNAEADPTNDCVFAFGASLDIRCSENSPYAYWHDAWWSTWHKALSKFRRARDVPTKKILDRIINPDLLTYYEHEDDEVSGEELRRRLLNRLNVFADTLWSLQRAGALDIQLETEHRDLPVVRFETSFLSQGLEPRQERALAYEMVRRFQAMIITATIYEELVAVVGVDERSGEAYLLAPSSAAFYWSRDQLEHVQELLERHLTELMTDPDICTQFHELLKLLNPSESGVQRDYLHKKIYDLRVFAETCLGMPQIINYTWHQVATQELSYSPRFSSKYWAENFNYMDFLAWHEYLRSEDAQASEPLLVDAARKARVIGQLARNFQGLGRESEVLTRRSRPLPSRVISWRAGLVDEDYNFFARVWALYAKLTASVQAQEVLHTRLSYPDYAIGKLDAARVQGLDGYVDEDGHQRLEMTLEGVSTNARFSEGSYALLVHESSRDAHLSWRSGENVILDEMTWEADHQRYRVRAHARNDEHPFFDEGAERGPGDWYLYPGASDTWTTKLFSGKYDTLYKRYELGSSWLGIRAAYLMDLLPPGQSVPARPERGYAFSTAELYAYAPALLPREEPDPEATLKTRCVPAPDPSQRRAIEMALSSTVSCIQGPPGTGKSQTIAALIDEFLARRGGEPARILVASFSYVPLQVVAEKVCEHVDADGQPTRAASLQKIFLRSKSRGSMELPGVHDLYRDGGNLVLDGRKLSRGRDGEVPEGYRRLEDDLEESFLMFGPAQQLFYLGQHSSSKSMHHHFVHSDFAFDLIIVDEASQMPVDQALTSISLVRRGEAGLSAPGGDEGREQDIDRASTWRRWASRSWSTTTASRWRPTG